MSTIKRACVLLLLSCGFSIAQDCAVAFRMTAAAASATFDNRNRGCVSWAVSYTSTGFTGVSVAFQSAPDSSGAPGAFVNFAGTVTSGVNPGVATTQAVATFTGYFPWLRVNVSGLVGSGTIVGLLYGWHNAPIDIGAASAISTVIAVGPDAVGAATTQNPVQISGVDSGGLVRRLGLDTTGGVVPANASSAQADAISNTQNTLVNLAGTIVYPRVTSLLYNGATYDRAPGNTLGAFVHGPIASGGGTTNVRPVLIGGESNVTTAVKWRFYAPGGNGVPAMQQQQNWADGESVTSTAAMLDQNGNIAKTMVAPYMLNSAGTMDRVRGSALGGLAIGGAGSGTAATLTPYAFAACDSNVVVNVAAGATTELVALVASKSIRVCAYVLTANVAGTAQLVYGTGANCGTGTTNISGAMNLATTGNIPMGAGIGELFKTASGNALCLTTVTSAVTGHLAYSQY